MNPHGERLPGSEERRYHSYGRGQRDHRRGVVPGETGDEALRARLARGCLLHKLQNARRRRLGVGPHHSQGHCRADVDHAR